jgi:hypothetical protein
MEYVDTGTTLIKHKGLYDFEGTYQMILAFLYDRQYFVQEDRYKDKKRNALGNEIRVVISAQRRINSYYRYVFKIDMWAWDAKEIDAVENGKKVKRMTGRILFKVSTGFDIDWTNKYTGSAFNEFLGSLVKKMKKNEIKILNEDYQEYENYALQTQIKNYLKMETDTNAY